MVDIPKLTKRQAWHLFEFNAVLWTIFLSPLIGLGVFLGLMTYLPALSIVGMVGLSSLFVGLSIAGFIQIYQGYQTDELEKREWRETEE